MAEIFLSKKGTTTLFWPKAPNLFGPDVHWGQGPLSKLENPARQLKLVRLGAILSPLKLVSLEKVANAIRVRERCRVLVVTQWCCVQ